MRHLDFLIAGNSGGPGGRQPRRWRFITPIARLAQLFVLGLTFCSPALAESEVNHTLNIPAEDLSLALNALAAAANEQVLFTTDLVAGLRSAPVRGEYSTDAALKIILGASGLEATRARSGVLLIRRSKAVSTRQGPEPTPATQPGSPLSGQGAQESHDFTADSLSEVSVTGTRIRARGLTPVGSTVIALDQAVVTESGLSSTSDVLSTLPSLLSLGNGDNIAAGTQIQNGFSGTYGNSPNIHGIGPGATLSLVNGHRSFHEGIIGNAFDPNDIPAQMLARIEIVQDGTSPIYGADAVAGTVNYVLRRPIDTLEVSGGAGWSKGQNNRDGTFVFGHTWNPDSAQAGGFIASAQRTEQGALAAAAYPQLYNDDFSPYGGPASLSFASPGNVMSGGSTYAIPTGQDGRTLTLAQLGPAGSVNRQNGWTGIQAIPQQAATRLAMSFEQGLSDSMQLFGDGLYSRRTFSRLADDSSDNITVSVPNSNPFSPCNPEHYPSAVVSGPAQLLNACATGALPVLYSTAAAVGPRINSGLSRVWEATAGLHTDLSHDWRLTVQTTFASHLQDTGTTNPTQPDPGSYNFFCDDSAFQCNPAGTLHQVPYASGTALNGPILDQFRYYELNADGGLFELAGGTVRLASGLEYDDLSSEKRTGTRFDVSRKTRSAYAELLIPVVGAANALPAVKELTLDFAGRIDDYSDTGTTTNPKIGINWSPLAQLRVHASYGHSFHPAPMLDLASLNPTWMSVPVAASAISPALCPQCTSSALAGPGGSNKLVYNEAMGAHTNLVPETSKSLSLGADWNSGAEKGLTASVNYWWIHYVNQVGNPQNNAGPAGQINQQYYNAHIIYNPTFFPTLAASNPLAYFEPEPHANLADPSCAAVLGKRVTTQALFNQLVRCANDSSAGAASAGGQALNGPVAASPSDVLAFGYYGQQNASSTLADGLDLSAGYGWSNALGSWKINGLGEYVHAFEVSVINGAPVIDEANHFGYPLRFKGRGQLSWRRATPFGDVSASVFVNYSSAYQVDLSLLPPGVPAGYAHVASAATADLTLVFDTGSALESPLARGLTVVVSSQNILNSTPPRVLDPAGGGGPGILFDPANGFPLGRTLLLRINKVL